MKFALPAIIAATFLTGCAHTQQYQSQDIEVAMNDALSENIISKDVLLSGYGENPITIAWGKARVNSIIEEEINWTLYGNAVIDGKPYASQPRVSAVVSGEYEWNESKHLVVKIDSVESVSLQGITSLHLSGVREQAKDVIAMHTLDIQEIGFPEIRLDPKLPTIIKETE